MNEPATGCTKGRSLYCYSITKFAIIFTDDKTPSEIDSWRPKDYPQLAIDPNDGRIAKAVV